MNNLIPKSPSKIKFQLWRGIGWIELAIIAVPLLFNFVLFIFVDNLSIFVKFPIFAGSLIIVAILLLRMLPRKKGWETILIILRFNLSLKNFKRDVHNMFIKKEKSTKNLIPYAAIKSQSILLDDNTNLISIELNGFDISLISNEERDNKINLLSKVFRTIKEAATLVKVEMPIDLHKNQNHLNSLKTFLTQQNINSNITNKGHVSRLKQLDNQILTNHQLSTSNSLSKSKFYLFVYSSKIKELLNLYSNLEFLLKQIGLNPKLNSGNEIAQTLFTLYNPGEVANPNLYLDRSLKDFLSPTKIEFSKNHINLGSKIAQIRNVYDYPLTTLDGWLAPLALLKNSTLILNLKTLDTSTAKTQIDTAIGHLKTHSLSKASDDVDYNQHLDSFNNLLNSIIAGEEQLKLTNLMIMTYADNHENLNEINSEFNSIIRQHGMLADRCSYQQKEVFTSFIPIPNDPLLNINGREIPSQTLGASFPFLNQELNDDTGFFMGLNSVGSSTLFDINIRNDKRKNSNMFILGTTGSGKSHTAKKIINNLSLTNSKIFIIDPEREYRDLCTYHDGTWIDVGQTSKYRINPLQIFSELQDDEIIKKDSLSTHIQFLEQFFKLACPGITEIQITTLSNILKELYREKGLTTLTDFDKCKASEFPIFNDLFLKINQLYKKKSKNHDLEILTTYISRLGAEGSDAYLWNGHTLMPDNSNNLVVLDIHTLTQSGNKRLINAQMFLILKYLENEVRINKHKNKKLIYKRNMTIVVDEAHLLLDSENTIALNFMFNMVKRIRKYYGNMIIITQNVNDFVGDKEIKKKTAAIINGCQYSMVFQLNANDLNDLNDLFSSYGGLSDSERMFISQARTGQCLFSIDGLSRMMLDVHISDLEKEAFV